MPNGLNPNIEDIDLDDYRFRDLALAARVAEWGRLHPEELHDFSYFHRVDMPRVAGEFRFKVTRSNLRLALEITGAVVSLTASMDQVKITLFRTRLRVQKSNEQSFAEYTIPLAEHSPSLVTERDFPVAFLFNHTRLLRIVRRFPEQMEAFPIRLFASLAF